MSKNIDKETLKALGITFSEEKEATILEALQTVLEERVGEAVAEVLEDDKLADLAKLAEAGDQEVIRKWVIDNVPDYQQIVNDEYDIMLGQLAADADTFDREVEPDKN